MNQLTITTMKMFLKTVSQSELELLSQAFKADKITPIVIRTKSKCRTLVI